MVKRGNKMAPVLCAWRLQHKYHRKWNIIQSKEWWRET